MKNDTIVSSQEVATPKVTFAGGQKTGLTIRTEHSWVHEHVSGSCFKDQSMTLKKTNVDRAAPSSPPDCRACRSASTQCRVLHNSNRRRSWRRLHNDRREARQRLEPCATSNPLEILIHLPPNPSGSRCSYEERRVRRSKRSSEQPGGSITVSEALYQEQSSSEKVLPLRVTRPTGNGATALWKERPHHERGRSIPSVSPFGFIGRTAASAPGRKWLSSGSNTWATRRQNPPAHPYSCGLLPMQCKNSSSEG